MAPNTYNHTYTYFYNFKQDSVYHCLFKFKKITKKLINDNFNLLINDELLCFIRKCNKKNRENILL